MIVLILLLAALIVTFWIGGAIFRFTLQPLAIPDSYDIVQTRERIVLIVTALCVFLGYFGAAVLLLHYAIEFWRHLRSRARAAGGGEQEKKFPFIPRFSISDMLTMIFSIGLAPMIMQIAGLGRADSARYFVSCLIIYPGLFLCALCRLEIHKVAPSWARLLFLGFAPYVALASIGSAAAAILLCCLPFVMNVGSDSMAGLFAVIFLGVIAISCVILIAARIIAVAAKRRAEPSSPQT